MGIGAKFPLGREGIPYESAAVRFAEIGGIGGIGARTFRTVPVLRDGDCWVRGSWKSPAILISHTWSSAVSFVSGTRASAVWRLGCSGLSTEPSM
jgi:hypothetical protein